ncbi:YqiA/YcfP family alpha/beta fold hydrolase [Azotobacter salinestris]|uniref:YqiA/YcfP family alpha/beta fold hydrolase n=1 Tax=Azotobacter salinestris TaxID=69964 RepID=UPI0032DF9117
MPSAAPSILYIHGFNSSSASHKARQLMRAMQALGLGARLRAPDLHHHPRQAIAQLETALAELGRPTLVGSSLGGYYATHLAERHGLQAVLINPAVRPYRLFDGRLGTQHNHHSGETWELTVDHLATLVALEVPPPQDPARYRVWLQTGDETLDWRDAATYYRHCTPSVETGGDHGFQGFAEHLPELLAFAGFDAALWRNFDFSEL